MGPNERERETDREEVETKNALKNACNVYLSLIIKSENVSPFPPLRAASGGRGDGGRETERRQLSRRFNEPRLGNISCATRTRTHAEQRIDPEEELALFPPRNSPQMPERNPLNRTNRPSFASLAPDALFAAHSSRSFVTAISSVPRVRGLNCPNLNRINYSLFAIHYFPSTTFEQSKRIRYASHSSRRVSARSASAATAAGPASSAVD